MANLENWVKEASIQDINEYLLRLHGYAENEDLTCGKWDKDGMYATSCECCSEFILALMTIALTERPELKKR